MATRIVHFGEDLYGRTMTLADAGFSVDSCTTLPKFDEYLARRIDAVVVEEDGVRREFDIVSFVRSHRWVPLILFEGAEKKFDPLQFDAAVPANTPARDWLPFVSAVIERCRAFVAECESLVAESSALDDQGRAIKDQSRAIRDFRRAIRDQNQAERGGARQLLSRSKRTRRSAEK